MCWTYQNRIGKLPTQNVSKKIALQKNVLWKKFLELRFDLIGNAYSTEITFMFLLILARTRKMLIKISPTWGIAYLALLKNNKRS